MAQFAIGRFTVTALADGFADMPFSFFTGREPKAIEAAEALSAARSSGIRLVFNQYLIDDGERLILVDTGPAGALGTTGQLPAALEALGVRLDQIGAVVVTHMHLDHTGGLIAGGRRNFPTADVYADRREVAHWTDPAKRAAAPDFLQSSFDAAAEVVRLYPRLQAIDGERQIARGVSLVDLTGHTPGHIGVRVEDGGRSVLMVRHALPPLASPRLLRDRLRVRAGPGRSTGDAGPVLPAGRGGEGADSRHSHALPGPWPDRLRGLTAALGSGGVGPAGLIARPEPPGRAGSLLILEAAMLHKYLEIASTPSVKAARRHWGSAAQYARLDGTNGPPQRSPRTGRGRVHR